MKKIKIISYSYKNKFLFTGIDELIKNSSGTIELIFKIYDQNNTNRYQIFKDLDYTHVGWDSRVSKFSYRVFDDAEYTLILNGTPNFEKNWDLNLVNFVLNKGCIVSGNSILEFNPNIKFYVEYNEKYSEDFTETFWIRNNFIFGKTDLLRQMPNLNSLKYLGEEEVLSTWAYENNIQIFSAPSNGYQVLDSNINKNDYIPFSIHHGYNNVVFIFTEKENIFNISNNLALELGARIGVNFSQISRLPFPTNDHIYDTAMELDSIGEERFINTINSIY